MMRGNPLLVFACILLAGLILLALFGAALAPFDPQASNVARALQPPSALHWFGTDHLGRDILSRVMVATRIDLLIAASAVGIAFLLGGPLGVLLGYRGGMLDNAVSRVVDMLMAFPMFVMAMALVAAFGNSVANIVYATALINLPFYIRIARA